ncbi:DUF397 domain-containing protein [Streptomyces apocyni]|uniref:DUF397 domain-containing protein n=1 Tax=Streptomyces apocyni TaxID=2654677 RepID=UPI0012E9F957|nr:DUF397 domain-containing protein [Streptomyces apocyni]
MRGSEHVSIPDASVVSMWRKSTYSGGSSGECLEVSDAYLPAAAWRKSTHSGGDSGACLEVNDTCPACVPVRDSKNPHGPALVFGPAAWTSFVASVKA